MKKYRTGSFGRVKIEIIEVERETDHFVWIKGDRHKKETGYLKYFDTWDGAKRHLVSRANNKVEGSKRNLIHAKNELDEMEALQHGD